MTARAPLSRQPGEAPRIPRRRLLGSALAPAVGLAVLPLAGRDDGGEDTSADPSAAATPSAPAPQAAAPVAEPASATPVWRRLEPGGGEAPPPRADHSLTADAEGRRVYLFGGRSGGTDLDELWELAYS